MRCFIFVIVQGLFVLSTPHAVQMERANVHDSAFATSYNQVLSALSHGAALNPPATRRRRVLSLTSRCLPHVAFTRLYISAQGIFAPAITSANVYIRASGERTNL